MSQLMLDVDQAGELKAAFRRTRGSDGSEWTNKDVKNFSEGSLLGEVLDVLHGRSKIIPCERRVELILQFIDTVALPAKKEKFVAKDKFVVDTSQKARVKISYLGDNFRRRFFDKVEEPAGETTLRRYRLKKDSQDDPIIGELGGKEAAETTLSNLFGLMELQGNGEPGVLLTNGYWNVFYIRDDEGVLWAGDVYWVGGGWFVDALSIDYPDSWLAGGQVFSRNSLAA